MCQASDWLKGSLCVTLKIAQAVNQPFFFSFTTTPLLSKTTNQIKFWLLMKGVTGALEKNITSKVDSKEGGVERGIERELICEKKLIDPPHPSSPLPQ